MENWKERLPWIITGAAIIALIIVISSRDSGSVAAGDPLDLYDDNGNGRITCAEARAHGIAPVHRSHPAYPYMRDGDNDGVVCE